MSIFLKVLPKSQFEPVISTFLKNFGASKIPASDVLDWGIFEWLEEFVKWLDENNYAILMTDPDQE